MHVRLLLLVVPVDPSGLCDPLIGDGRVRRMRRGLSVDYHYEEATVREAGAQAGEGAGCCAEASPRRTKWTDSGTCVHERNGLQDRHAADGAKSRTLG